MTNSPKKSSGRFTRQLFNRCPREKELHTPTPEDYTEWVEWAQKMQDEGFIQKRCPECGRFAIWEKKIT